ncbi:MAG: hypothetical protein ABSE53_13775 [Terracidiphilus sp.]|jgi:hypothetical protein
MNMIGHQAVADQGGTMLFYVFPQQAQIHFSICVAVQDKLPRVSTLCRMMRNFYGYHAGESCDAFQLT